MSTSDRVLQRMRELHPSLIDLSLGRIERVLEAMGDPHRNLPPVIHVAGTNGKGSVIAFLRAILEAAGRRVHVFTSPHLRKFNERIRLAGDTGSTLIDEPSLVDVLERAEAANAHGDITFFEITTAAAFLAFAETPADVLLLETGLGGRLDATNVVDQPALTVITPVSIDHSHYLGNTLSEIAAEKAGIIKQSRPCIVAPQPPEARKTIERIAYLKDAPLFIAGRDWDSFMQQGRLVYQDDSSLLDLPAPKLIGQHQIANAGTAIAAARRLPDVEISTDDIETGLTTAEWPGRLQRLGPGGLYRHARVGTELWLDGGHNPAAGAALATAVAALNERVPKPLHLICGMLTRKDAANFIRPFSGLTEFMATVPVPGSENSYSADDLAEIAQDQGIPALSAANVATAIALSNDMTMTPARVLICGSLYLAGHVLDLHEGDTPTAAAAQ